MLKGFSVETERLLLTLIQRSDITLVFETMNSQSVAETVTFLSWPMTKSQAADWCEKAELGFETQADFLFLAKSKDDGVPIGCICLLKGEELIEMEVGYWVRELSGQKVCHRDA